MQIVIDAENWSRYLKAKAQANALKREIEGMETAFNLPVPAEVAAAFGANEGDKLCVEIVNGNAQTIGKLSVYWFGGSETPAGWRKRIS